MAENLDQDLLQRITTLVGRVILETTGRTVVLSPDDRLLENGDLDSMSIAHLVLAIQTEIDVELDVTDLNEETFGSIAAITRLIADRLAA